MLAGASSAPPGLAQDLAAVAGADLVSETPQVVEWLLRCGRAADGQARRVQRAEGSQRNQAPRRHYHSLPAFMNFSHFLGGPF